MRDFTSHDVVKLLLSFYRERSGSGNLYEAAVQHVIRSSSQLKGHDFIRFFSVFPRIQYLYENNMNP